MNVDPANQSEMADKLNNVLTAITIRCGVLEAQASGKLKDELSELHRLAIEAVRLTRVLLPNGNAIE